MSATHSRPSRLAIRRWIAAASLPGDSGRALTMLPRRAAIPRCRDCRLMQRRSRRAGQAQEGGGRSQPQGITLAQLQDAVYGTSGPYITPGGNVYGGHTIAAFKPQFTAVALPVCLRAIRVPRSRTTARSRADATDARPGPVIIPGGQSNEYRVPAMTATPSLIDMTQPQPGARPSQPGHRSATHRRASTTDDTPEPQDTTQPPQDPNAPRPPENIPGQPIGARRHIYNAQLDNPRTNRNYRDSGRTDYPQGRPGIDFRTARQAGIEPLFRIDDINVRDLDARLVENINRALKAMEQRTGIPANSLGGHQRMASCTSRRGL